MARNILLIIVVTIFLLPEISQAQRWKRFKQEVGVSLGASNFLGDLGGNSEGDGSRFGDLDLSNTRPVFGVWYKYRFHDRFAAKANLFYGRVYGTDENTPNIWRRNRNHTFRSPIIELSTQGEFYFFREKIGAAYRIKGVRGYGSTNIAGYVFGGIGVIFYDPHGKTDDGNWVRLSDLNTEGQGLPGGPEDYSRFALTFPLGFGFKYNFSREWGIAIEYGLRLTPSDYLDDTSTRYYDDDAIAAAYGELAREMSDRRLSDSRFNGNARRGNDERKDSYMFGTLSLTYRIRTATRSRIRF